MSISTLRSFHSSRLQQAGEQPDSKSTSTSTALASSPSTTAEKLKKVQAKVQAQLKDEQEDVNTNFNQGGLARSSIFYRHLTSDLNAKLTPAEREQKREAEKEVPLSERSASNMAQALNPQPIARSRWQRKMVIRHIQREGRLTREMEIARTERTHTSRSHFFKTSMKKLAPLTRQIAGKSLDEAILQMRFSKKKVAKDVREHLLVARAEAITSKGMGLKENRTEAESKALIKDPSVSKPLPGQTPIKTKKKGVTPDPTDIYVSEAWTNRGSYGRLPDYRARGRMYIMRPPHTGMTVVLKEERTKTRIAAEKEAKAIRKRMQKKIWVQLPDRPITMQRQHLLW